MYASRFLLGVGVVMIFLSWVAFKFPEIFFHGRRSGFWYHWIGATWTRRLIRYVSVPLVLFIGSAQISVGLSHERMIWKAGHGDAEAQYQLGDHFYRGDVQAEDEDLACEWFRHAAENGSIPACLRLGRIHAEKGEQARAFAWFIKAAERGDAGAEEHVAYNYAMGIGVDRNLDQAWHWYYKAAETGRTSAQLNLGRLTLKHFSGDSSKGAQARQIIETAADTNDSQGEAALLMAKMALEGIGGPKRMETAYAWACFAVARRCQQAMRTRAVLEKVMSPRQKQSAVREKQKLFFRYASQTIQ